MIVRISSTIADEVTKTNIAFPAVGVVANADDCRLVTKPAGEAVVACTNAGAAIKV